MQVPKVWAKGIDQSYYLGHQGVTDGPGNLPLTKARRCHKRCTPQTDEMQGSEAEFLPAIGLALILELLLCESVRFLHR